jgi:hypothetical protein
MRPSLFVALSLLLLPACSRSVEDSCMVVCEKNALCQPGGSGVASCNELCLELAKDEAYAEALAVQADCYEQQDDYYEEEKGVCLAIEGGACRVQP